MKRLFLGIVICTLAACGADGDPEPPRSDVSVSGDVRIGVVGEI